MKKRVRRVLKKGKLVSTRTGNVVIHLANKIIKELKPYCSRIQIAGSIRRKEKNPVDIDIVLIPKNKSGKQKIQEIMRKKEKARFIQGGEKESVFRIKGVKVELYYTNNQEWGACLLAYSSKTGSSIGLRMVAKRKGFKLNQHGLFKNNKRIAGRTEEEIYHTLGRPWKSPERR